MLCFVSLTGFSSTEPLSVGFAEKMGEVGNQALIHLLDLLTFLGQNFHLQGETEHFAQGFEIGAKCRSITAISISSLPYWKVGGDFLCQQKAEQPAPPFLGTWMIRGMLLPRVPQGRGSGGGCGGLCEKQHVP